MYMSSGDEICLELLITIYVCELPSLSSVLVFSYCRNGDFFVYNEHDELLN